MNAVATEYGVRSENLIVTPGMSREALAAAYHLMAADGVLETFFYQGVPGIEAVMEWADDHRVLVYGCFRARDDGSDTADLIGLGTVNQIQRTGSRTKAEVGFAFLNRAGLWERIRCGRMMIGVAFEESGVDVLFGTTPEPNAAAVAYAKRLGFTAHGPIPDFVEYQGKPCGVIITRLNREMWSAHGPK